MTKHNVHNGINTDYPVGIISAADSAMTDGDLHGILTASEETELRRLLFHPNLDLGASEWRGSQVYVANLWEQSRNGYCPPAARNLASSADNSIPKGVMFLLRKIDVRETELLSLLNSHNFAFYTTVCQQNLSTLNQITELKDKCPEGYRRLGFPQI